MALSDLDFRGLFESITTQTTKTKVGVTVSTEASSRMTGEFTAQFFKENNLPDSTLIAELSKRQQMSFVVGLALYIKLAGHSDKIVKEVLKKVTGLPEDKWATVKNKSKKLFVIRQAREYDIRFDLLERNRAGAMKAFLEGTIETHYKKKDVVHWPTLLNVDDCGTITAKLIHAREKYGLPKIDAEGRVTNWPGGVDSLIKKCIQQRADAETTWKETGAIVKADVSSVFGSRGKDATWDLKLDPLLCVAIAYEAEEDDDQTDEIIAEMKMESELAS